MDEFVRKYFNERRMGYRPYSAARIACSFEAWCMDNDRRTRERIAALFG